MKQRYRRNASDDFQDQYAYSPSPSTKKFVIKYLNQKQKDYGRTIHANTIIFAIGAAGSGKAQPLDALVLTPGGFVAMGDLKIGSLVTTPHNRPASVMGIYPQGEIDSYRLTFADGAQTEASGDHLWKVYSDKFNEEFDRDHDGYRILTTDQLRLLLSITGLKTKLYIPIVTELGGADNIDLPLNPYLMGVLLGDGYFGAGISLTTADEEIRARVENIVSKNEYILVPCKSQYGDRQRYGYYIRSANAYCRDEEGGHSNFYVRTIKQMGLSGKKSYEKFIPEVYLSGSISQKWEILRGLFDTDGTIGKSGDISFTTTSAVMAKQIQNLIRSLGGTCWISTRHTMYEYAGEQKMGRESFTLHVRHQEGCRFFSLSRKLARVPSDYQYTLRRRIKKIEHIGKKEAQCIMIDDPEHLYVTDDYVVTHNTHLAALHAMDEFLAGRIDRIVICRPVVNAGGEQLGFLPGTLQEKMDPYVRPIFDAFAHQWNPKQLQTMLEYGKIEIAPLAYMRGRTFNNAFIICDEAQNATDEQLLMLLSRLGSNSKMIITGDPTQRDIAGRPFERARRRLSGINGIAFVEFTEEDVVRHPLVQKILQVWQPQTRSLDPGDPMEYELTDTVGSLPEFVTSSPRPLSNGYDAQGSV